MTDLPSGWRRVKLGEIESSGGVLLRNGFPCGSNNEDGSGVPQLRPMNINNEGQINLTFVKGVEPGRDVSSYNVQNHDVIFNNTNSYDLVGKTALWQHGDGYVLSNHMTFVRFSPEVEVEPGFVASQMHWLWLHRYFESIRRQHVNQASISLEKLRDVEIILPPLAEQRAIAATLRAVQNARNARRREIELERERKAALMDELFSHGISGRCAAQRKTIYGLVPEYWSATTLAQCAEVQTGAAKGRNFGGADTVDLPYLRVANVQDGYLDLAEIKHITIRKDEAPRYLLKDGDVVVTEGGDADKLGRGFVWSGQIENCIHQNHVFAVRSHPDKLLPEFLAYLFQSSYGKNYFLSVAHRTTNLACINSSKLKAFPVILPAMEEQRLICHAIKNVDAKIAALNEEVARLDELFRALLEELMSGRLSTAALMEATRSLAS